MNRGTLLRFGALTLMWGSSFLFMKLALGGLSPVQVVLARLGAGAVVLLAILAARRVPLPRNIGVWAHLALMGLVSNIVPFSLFAFAEERITSGLAGVLNATTPLFTLVVAMAVLPQERLSALRATGLGFGFAGVLILIGPWDANPLTSSLTGQLAGLGAAASYAVGFVYTRRFLTGRGLPALSLATGQILAAWLILLALSPWVASTPVALTPTVVLGAIALGVLGTGLAYPVYYSLLIETGATTTALVTYLIPVVAVALGIAVLDEPATWNVFAGAAVVVLGVALAEGRLGRRRPVAPGVEAPAATARDA